MQVRRLPAPAVCVLLAEGNPIAQAVAVDLLRRAGAGTPCLAANARQIMEAARAHRLALVLLDVQLPDDEAWGACRALRHAHDQAALPIVAMASNPDPALRARCAAAGIDDCLSKPLQFDAVRAVVARWLAAPAPIDWSGIEGLDAAAGLRFFGDRHEALERGLRHFIDLHATDLADMDPTSLKKALHALAGAAAVVGARGVHQQSEALSTLLRGDMDAAVLRRELKALGSTLENLIGALRSRLPPPRCGS
jgi:two-component system sensor histidine kinase/response regulator